MQGGAWRGSWIPRIGSGQNRHVRKCQRENSVDCDHTFPFTAVIYVALQLFDVSRQNIGAEFGVIQNAPTGVLIAHAFENAQGRDHERTMGRNGAREPRIEDVTPVREEVRESISIRFDRIERLPLAVNVNYG